MGRRIEAREVDNPAGSKPSSRCVEANDGLRVLTKRNPTALTSTDHQMVINGNYRPGPMLSSHKTRDAIHANFSVTRKCHVSCHEGGVSRLASTLQKVSIAAPASTVDTSEGRRSLLSGPTTGVSRVRRYHATRIAELIAIARSLHPATPRA
jgi:hypothetical protein